MNDNPKHWLYSRRTFERILFEPRGGVVIVTNYLDTALLDGGCMLTLEEARALWREKVAKGWTVEQQGDECSEVNHATH